MTDLRTTFSPEHVIPVPRRIDDATDRATWAAEIAERFATTRQPVENATERIAAALEDLARLRDDDSALFLLANDDASVLAPLTVYRTGAPLTRDELAGFLSTADTVLPPTGLFTSSARLGEGFSSSLLHALDEGQYATRRWVFFGRDHDVVAVLGPVVPLGLAQIEVLAERILEEAELDGFEPAADPELLDALMAATVRDGDVWQVRPAP